MSIYFIGDVHGCYKQLNTLLDQINFDPNSDTLYLTGDLVARGPNSLEVLRLIRKLNKSIHTVLGNHDIHLLKMYFEKKTNKNTKSTTTPDQHFKELLCASDADELIYWLRHQPILYINEKKKILMSHAGIHPYWDIHETKRYANTIEKILSSDNPALLFKKNNMSNKHCSNDFTKIMHIQKNIDIFTKIRYLYLNGILDTQHKDSPENTNENNIYPWFYLLKFIVPSYNIIFGHWASLKTTKKLPTGVYGLDSGCCWGEYLTALKWETKTIIRVSCG